jgi:hypothetical protein
MRHSWSESKGVTHGAVQFFLSSPPPPPPKRTLFANNQKHNFSLRVKTCSALVNMEHLTR